MGRAFQPKTFSYDLFPFKAKHSTGFDILWGDALVLISIHLRRNMVGASFSAEGFFIGKTIKQVQPEMVKPKCELSSFFPEEGN